MGPSRILAAAGARTLPRAGWRSGAASALAAVASQPTLWLLGATGFLLRGGALLLTAAILIVPTPVELRVLLGENLGSAGLAPGFVAWLAVAAVMLGLLLLGAMLALAQAELTAFERLTTNQEADEIRRERWSQAPVGAPRRNLLGALFTVQLLTLAALAVAALPLAAAIAAQAYEEVVRPGLGGTLYSRVLTGVREPLFFFIVALVAIEMVSAIASRRLLVRSFSRAAGGTPMSGRQLLRALPLAVFSALIQPLRRPLSTLATLIAGWVITLAVLAPVGWALAASWQSVRSTYLGQLNTGPEALLAAGMVTVVLALIWVLGLILLGFVSALRAALWSVDGLR